MEGCPDRVLRPRPSILHLLSSILHPLLLHIKHRGLTPPARRRCYLMPLKLLLSNDDGIDAEGLAALRTAAEAVGVPHIVAPDRCHSGCGHQVTTHHPIRITRRDARSFVTDGTPADCVRVALDRLVADADWVLAGINHGGNLGADL